jgi:hypothetical protein
MSSYAKVDVNILYEMCNNYIEYYDKLYTEYLIAYKTGNDPARIFKLRDSLASEEDMAKIQNVAELCYFILTTNKMGPLIEKITISDNIAKILNNFHQEVNKQNEEMI